MLAKSKALKSGLAISLSLLISSCLSSPAETENSPFFYTYETEEFSISAPDEWDVIDKFSPEFPISARVGFKNNIKESDFVANLHVAKEQNEEAFTSMDCAQKKFRENKENLLEFKLLGREEITLEIADGESATLMYIFAGRDKASKKTIEIMQSALCVEEDAWIITAMHLPEEDEFVVEKMETMLKSFKLKK